MQQPDPTEETYRLDFVVGEVHALLSFSLALAKTHPSAALAAQFHAASQVALADLETRPATDAVIEGFQFAANMFRRALRDPKAPEEPQSR
jgi:hypothetical protein